MRSFTFNGIKKPWIIMLQGRQKAPFAPLTRNILTVPGMPGGHLQSTDVEPLVINQPIGFRVKDDEHALQLKDELAAWLVTDEPVPLQFDDEPGRTYYAVVQNTLDDFEKFAELRQGTIQFLCLDPYAYGEEITATFPSDVVTLTNEGTADADPIFELEVLEPVTFAMIQNQDDKYMMIGRPIDVDDIPTEQYPRALRENGSSLTGWSHRTAGYDVSDGPFSGLAGGNMATTGYSFIAEEFGSNPNGWTGPMIRRSFTEPLQDFKATVDISMFNTAGGCGKVVVQFLDELDNIVVSMGIYDATNGYPNNHVCFRLGGAKEIVNTIGDNYGVYNNGRMWLQLTRQGEQFKAFSYRMWEDGTLHARHTELFYDRTNQFQTPIQQVQIYIAKAKNYTPFEMHMHGLSVFGINDLDDLQVPYIAETGDIITFDHRDEELRINGEDRTDIKDFGATYFKLKKGINQLVVYPSASFNTSIRYRPRYE